MHIGIDLSSWMGPNWSIPLSLFQSGETGVTEVVVKLLIGLAIILFVAKISGEMASRYLKLPPVLAELGAGIAIGPFALGGLELFGFGPMFPIPVVDGKPAIIPVSNELWALAQIGSVVLLFAIGLETNLKQFLRYAGPASAVALGGVIFPFSLGVGATVLFGSIEGGGIFSPQALFVGAIMTATSVGITARVLADLNRLDAPEGVTIIAAAVVDDVLGILVLTVVVGLSAADHFSFGALGWVAAKAVGFWLGLTVVGILAAPYIDKFIGRFRTQGAALVLTLALAFLAAGLAEVFGLAFIIGAFSIGLALSTTDLAHRVEQDLQGITDFLVPVFFVVMGMLVDVSSMLNALGFGLIITVIAILSKVLGSGGPALITGFNLRGSARIGVGMMPRGEVALIIAGIGLAEGLIGQRIFGVSILMTVVTTLIAPLMLIPLFKSGGSGLRGEDSSTESAVGGSESASGDDS